MDDNKKTTKDVVNKKQKQMLNQEEIDPTKIAEVLGGYIIVEKLGPDGKFIPNNPKSSFEKSFSRSKEGRKLKRQQSLTRGSGGFGPSERISPDDTTTQKTQQKVANQRVKTAKKQSTQGFTNEPIDNVDTKQIVRDESGNPVANPPSESAEAKAKRTKEIKDQSRKTRGSKKPLVDQGKFSMDTRTVDQAPQITGGGRRKTDREGGMKGAGRQTPSMSAAAKKRKLKIASKRAARKAAIRGVATKSAFRTGVRAVPKTVAKYASKRIPFIGSAAAAAEAGVKLATGDFVGAGIAGAEAIANIMAPGLDAVIGAAGAARDIRKAGQVAGVAMKTGRAAKKFKTAKSVTKNVKPKAYGTMGYNMKKFMAKVPRSKRTLGLKRPVYGGAALAGAGMGGQMVADKLKPKPKFGTGVVGTRSV